jgi:hypothetical protein
MWLGEYQARVIEYQRAEKAALLERLGKHRLRLTDGERRRLAKLRFWSRRTSSRASCARRWTWKRSNTMRAFDAHARTSLMYACDMSMVTALCPKIGSTTDQAASRW